ncbi:MAG TPA: phosphopyruvate hydratase [Methanospirillum sp.]|nr:phosphopyruvate hydratase [Methanospirillum sp.]
MTTICAVTLRIIYDSRGRRTIEAEITTEHGFGRASAPGGASTGLHEAMVIDPDQAVDDGRRQVIPHLIGLDSQDQIGFDSLLREIDGTDTFAGIGANLSVALSLANAKAAADSIRVPLWKHLGGAFVTSAPLPLGNVIGGGVHADHATEIQEFLVVPTGSPGVREAVAANARVHSVVKELLNRQDISCGKGDEGAWAPAIPDQDAFEIVNEAIDLVSEETGFQIRMGIDAAASQFYDSQAGVYRYRDGTTRTAEDQIAYIAGLIDEYGLVYVEDPLYEEDFSSFAELNAQSGNNCLICGDDLFVTSSSRIRRGIAEGSANCVLIKPNQIGTLTGAHEAITLARKHGMETVMSHRSGETEDATIAHLGCAFDCVFMKTGIVGGERTAKLNELIRIEESMYERK